MSEIERLILEKKIPEFRAGLKHHCESLQAYLNVWCDDPENPFGENIEMRQEIFRLVCVRVLGEYNEDVAITKKRHLIRNVLRRWFKKISK